MQPDNKKRKHARLSERQLSRKIVRTVKKDKRRSMERKRIMAKLVRKPKRMVPPLLLR